MSVNVASTFGSKSVSLPPQDRAGTRRTSRFGRGRNRGRKRGVTSNLVVPDIGVTSIVIVDASDDNSDGDSSNSDDDGDGDDGGAGSAGRGRHRVATASVLIVGTTSGHAAVQCSAVA